MKYDMNKPCPHCGGNPKIANPTGKCSHIHYPEAVNKELLPLAAEEKAGDEGLRDSQTPSPAYLEENAKLWAEAVKAQQELYRENQRLQCEIDRLSRQPVSEQKAQAPAGLVEELRYFLSEHELVASCRAQEIANGCLDIIDGYRPAEAKADEGLREFVVRIVERAKYLGHKRVDLPVRILEKSLEMYPSHPSPSRTEELVKRVREWLDCRELYTLDYDGNPTVIDKGFATAQEEVGKILADFEKGAK